MLIKVTREHIEKAAPIVAKINKAIANDPLHEHENTGENCPVAQALKDIFKTSYANVNCGNITVGIFPQDNIIFTVKMPDKCFMWINHYDSNFITDSAEPFEFELDLTGVKL